jgi:Photosynthetic reaction centre cytochrome C subunit
MRRTPFTHPDIFRQPVGKQALNDITVIPEYYPSWILGGGYWPPLLETGTREAIQKGHIRKPFDIEGGKMNRSRSISAFALAGFLFALPAGTHLSVSLFAQQPGGRGAVPSAAPKNLKLLDPKSDIRFVMQNFNEALGVQCTYCHAEGDFAADGNPKKEMARKMIGMVRLIDTSFPSSAGVFPDGYHEVDCMTCHRGTVKPETVAPRKFYNRGNSLGDPPPEQRPGVSLKLLPPDTHVHGADSLMGEFRDALNVDCNYCHGGGRTQEVDINPRKDIARKMIMLVRQINSNFPGTGVFPVGNQEVTCYTCHRGDTHPVSVSNRRYDLPTPKQ